MIPIRDRTPQGTVTDMRARKPSADRRLTIFKPDGAVPGRVLRFTPTGMVAVLDGEVPAHSRLRFTVHIPGAVVSGELMSREAQTERTHRLQISALTEGDRALLKPYMEED